MINKARLDYLFEKYLYKDYSIEERDELFEYLADPANDVLLEELVDQAWEKMPVVHEQDDAQADIIFRSIISPAKRVPRKTGVIRLAAAAAILAFVIWSLMFVFRQAQDDGSLRQAQTDNQDIKAPDVNRAMITLSDGRQVYLDQVGSGSLANVSGVEVIKMQDGKIVYRREASIVNRVMVYNTLTNPRGSKVIDITLSDGSRVWLNAGSSLRYPVVFVGNERKVLITGEAYFEINHDKSKPFKVGKGEMEVTVLGTHFNVNAYDDESLIKVTLLEGKVRVQNKSERVQLSPGQSAFVPKALEASADEVMQVKSNVDLEVVMAWKNGLFIMHKADIAAIMREISRWYDVEIVYLGSIPNGKITGDLSRSMNLSKVLQVMALSGVKFRIEGRKVLVIE